MNKAICGFIARRRRRIGAALCIHAAVVLAGVCVARSVLAQAAAPPVSEAAAEQARVLFKEGLDFLDGARYVEALDRFQRAYLLWKNSKILLNVATTLRALGQNADAVTAYALYLETAEPDSTHRAEVAAILRELDSRRIDIVPAEPRRVDRPEPSRRAPQRTAPAAPQPEARETPARGWFALRPRLRVLARTDLDATSGGVAGAGGIAFEPLDFLRVTGGAVIGAHRGAWVGLECSPFRGPVRPVLGTSAPIFFAGEVYAGVSGELGVRFVASDRLAPFVRAAIAHFPSVPSGYASTLFVPSAGLEVGL